MRVTAAFIALLLVAGVATAAPFAYVPNEGSATVSVIDTASDRCTGVGLGHTVEDWSMGEFPLSAFAGVRWRRIFPVGKA